MIGKTAKSLLILMTISLVIGISGACNPLAPSLVPTTHPVLEETASHTPISTTTTSVPTATLPSTQTPIPTFKPERTLLPTATQTPQAFIITDTLSEVGFSLPLIIQHVSETEATLFFELDTPANGSLFYWSTADPDDLEAVHFSADENRHQVRLAGLDPGTKYQTVVGLPAEGNNYQQPNFRGGAWGSVNFKTPAGEEPLRIGVIGDSGLGEESTAALVRQMASHELDFVLHTGDLVYLMNNHPDPFDAYAEKYYQPLSPLLHSLPIYPVVGNHDIEAATLWMGEPFYYYAFPAFLTSTYSSSSFNGRNQWYAVAYGRIQFLLLDTQALFGEDGLAEQTSWLEERLADRRFDFTIPVFHVPPFSSGPHLNEGSIVEQIWGHLFTAGQIPVVFSGHEHFYERLEVDGITYVISGGGTSVLYNMVEQHSENRVFDREMHFLIMEIYRDRIDIKAITETGELLDQFNIPLEALES